MQNKRGLSDVVTTLLIILLAVVAVAIIGGIVLNNVNKAGVQIQSTQECSQIDVKPVKCFVGNATSNTTATYNRGSSGSGSNIVKLSLIFTKADGSTVIKEVSGTDVPSPLNSVGKSYNDLNVSTSLPKNLKVAAVIRGSDGKDVTCEPSQFVIDCTA